MVELAVVQESNKAVASALPAGMVAVFAGATSGIGEFTLKAFFEHASKPKVYFLGRSQEAADRIIGECKALNADGQISFIQADLASIKTVDKVCAQIREQESAVNLLFLCQGAVSFDRKGPEGLPVMASLTYYSRMRFIVNLLPQLQAATGLRRVVTVVAGTKEGKVYTDDIPGRNVPLSAARGHIITTTTLTLERFAQDAPTVSFIHDYPGFVKTNFVNRPGFALAVASIVFSLLGMFRPRLYVPPAECGERHLFLATSARYPAVSGESNGVPPPAQVPVARGSNGKVGSGAYTIDEHCESGNDAVLKVLEEQRQAGVTEVIWKHTTGEFARITGA